MRGARLRLILPLAALAVFFAYPLAMTLRAAADASAWQWIAGDYVQERLRGAVLQATLSTLATLAVAVPLAWHHHRHRMAWTGTHLAIHAAPFVLPVFVIVGAVREMLGPGGWLSPRGDLLAIMGPLGAIVIAHILYNYGFAARVLHATLERRPWHLEAAAKTLGADRRAAFWRVTVPLLAPSLTSVALLVWLFCFTSFGVVLLLGEGLWATPETLIYQNLRGIFPRTSRAAAIGVLQLLLNVILLGAYFVLHRRAEALRSREDPRPVASGRAQAMSWVVLVLASLPLLGVLAGGFRVGGSWTLEAWRALLDAGHPAHLPGFDLGAVLLRSLGYAVATAFLAAALAWSLGQGLRRAGRLRGLAEWMAAVPLGSSSVLLGLGFLLAFGAGSWLDLRGQGIAIVLVHTLVAFPLAARIVLPAMAQHDRRLDAAAAALGAPPWSVDLRVRWPLLRGPLLAAAAFAAAISLGDFGASLVLARRDTQGLAIWIHDHDQPFRLLMHAQSVALTGLLLVLVAVVLAAGERWGRRT